MPKDKPREPNRKDIWLTEKDKQNIASVIAIMEREGVKPARDGRYSLSEVVRFALERIVKDL